MYKVQVTPLIGLPRFDGWAHVTTISSGNMVFALSVEGQHARNIGRDLVDLINQDTTIASGAELYKLATKLIQDTEDKEGKLSLACGFLGTEAKSTFCVFNGSITLKRDGKSGQLLQATDQLQIIEGKTQLEDTYVFATEQANQFLGEVKQKFDQGFDADTIVISITPGLHLEETTAMSAMAFVDFRDTAQVIQEKTETVAVSEPEYVPLAKEKEFATEASTTTMSVEVDEEPDQELDQDVSWLAPASEESTEAFISDDQLEIKNTEIQQSPSMKFDQAKHSATAALHKTSVLAGLFFQSLNLKKMLSWRPPVAGEVYVGQAAKTKQKRVVFGVGLIALLLFAAVGLFIYQRSQKAAAASSMVEPFLAQIQEVEAQVADNPIEARQNLQKIVGEMEALEASQKDNSIAQKKIAQSIADAQKLYDEISGKEVFSELPIFFNSRDQEQDILITNSEIADGQFVFFDHQKKQGLVVNDNGEVVNSFSTESIESEVKDVSIEFGLDTLWILADQVFSTEPSSEDAEPSNALEDNDRLNNSTMLAAFSDSLYVFNADERTIFKYSRSDDDFNDPTRWIRSVPGLDFEQIVDLMIDGDVWLSSNTGEIFRLRSGNRQDFSFSGLEKPFSSSVYFYSQEELQNLYFLEPAESRVVITDKSGEFIREVTSSSLAAASHIIVSPDETKLLAVSGSTVYLIEL